MSSLDLPRWFAASSVEWLGWALQAALILLLVARPGARLRLPPFSLAACLLALGLGWVWRLTYDFALSFGGRRFWIGDEHLRWLRGVRFARDPFLVEPGEIWVGGAYYVHGAVVRLLGDSLHATAFLASFYNLLSLVGLFVFAQALFRNRGLSVLCVAVAAPLWMQVLLGTGLMTELPVVGLLLAGSGLTLLGLRAQGGFELRWIVPASLCFAAATGYHLVAWIYVAVIQIALALHQLSRRGAPWGRRALEWSLGAAISGAFMLFWLASVWVVTGSPFSQLGEQVGGDLFKIGGPTKVVEQMRAALDPLSFAIYCATAVSLVILLVLVARAARARRVAGALVVAGALASLWRWQTAGSPLHGVQAEQVDRLLANLVIYPAALTYALFFAWPLAAYGVVRALWPGRRSDPMPRSVMLVLLASLVTLVATALLGGANLTPYRSLLPLAAALIPFLLEPLLAPASQVEGVGPPRGARALAAALCITVLGLSIVHHHRAVFANRMVKNTIPRPFAIPSSDRTSDADAEALGAWIRAEAESGLSLSKENWRHPFRVAIVDGSFARLVWFFVLYSIGNADWVELDYRSYASAQDVLATVDSLEASQLLISDQLVEHARLKPIARIGHFQVYEAVGEPQRREPTAPGAGG